MRKLRLSDIKQFVPDPKVNATVSLSGITNSPKLMWLKTTVIFFFPDWWASQAVPLLVSPGLAHAAALCCRVGWAGRSQWLLSPVSQLVLLSLGCLGSPAHDLSLFRSHTCFLSWWSQGSCLRAEAARPFDSWDRSGTCSHSIGQNMTQSQSWFKEREERLHLLMGRTAKSPCKGAWWRCFGHL